MTLETSKPACLGQTGSGISKAVAAFIPEFSAPQVVDQQTRAAFVLSRRFSLPIPTAALVAALAGLGERVHG